MCFVCRCSLFVVVGGCFCVFVVCVVSVCFEFVCFCVFVRVVIVLCVWGFCVFVFDVVGRRSLVVDVLFCLFMFCLFV